MAPEWLRSHMTLLATPGVIEHSGEEPVAFLAHVGVAWLAVKQETPGGEGSNSVAS
jgi:hypothetical protein